MKYLLFTHPVIGTRILPHLRGCPPSFVVTELMEIDSWKRTLYRLARNKKRTEDLLRYFYKIPFCDYYSFTNEIFRKRILKKYGIEIAFIASFQKILKKPVIDAFPNGIFNFHPSLLPAHGGSNPFFWIIYNNDEVTGTTCHRVTEEVDRGNIILQTSFNAGKLDSKQLERHYISDVATFIPDIIVNYREYMNKNQNIPDTMYDPSVLPDINEIQKEKLSLDDIDRINRAFKLYRKKLRIRSGLISDI